MWPGSFRSGRGAVDPDDGSLQDDVGLVLIGDFVRPVLLDLFRQCVREDHFHPGFERQILEGRNRDVAHIAHVSRL